MPYLKYSISCVITFLKTWPSSEYKLLLLLQAESTKTTINKVAIYFKDFIVNSSSFPAFKRFAFDVLVLIEQLLHQLQNIMILVLFLEVFAQNF